MARNEGIPRLDCIELAECLIEEFPQDALIRWDIAGEYRRLAPVRRLVLVIEHRDQVRVDHALGNLFGCDSKGKPRHSGWIGDIPVEVRLAEPDTWGTMMLRATGPRTYWAELQATARKMGLQLDWHGLWNREGDLVAASSERKVYKALGKSYRLPSRRGER